MLHVLSTIHVRPGKAPELLALLREKLFPILEGKAGWTLVGCFEQRTGRLNTLIDLWQLADYNHFSRGFEIYRDDLDYGAIRVGLDAMIERETLVFLERRL